MELIKLSCRKHILIRLIKAINILNCILIYKLLLKNQNCLYV